MKNKIQSYTLLIVSLACMALCLSSSGCSTVAPTAAQRCPEPSDVAGKLTYVAPFSEGIERPLKD